jgi:hypothetical protein
MKWCCINMLSFFQGNLRKYIYSTEVTLGYQNGSTLKIEIYI